MTLVERLGRGCNCGKCKMDLCCCHTMEEAKDRIEQLKADVARLSLLLAEALQAMNLEGVCEPNCMACGDILAALKETKHD